MKEIILKDLNREQKKAVQTKEGPLLIIAGAGSGKTRALTHRISYLIGEGVPPENILAITFTNRAANEMKERVFNLLKKISFNKKGVVYRGKPEMGTFHALGAKILRKEIGLLGRSGDFIIYDEKDRRALVKEIMKREDVPGSNFQPGGVLSTISMQKNELVDPEEYVLNAEDFYSRVVAKIYQIYEKRLKEINALDFDDLLLLPIKVFEKYPGVLKKYQDRFKYILVDEYQDTNHAQYTLLKKLSSNHKNICVVGDDWQSIYMFRGADFRNILNFKKDWPEARVVTLEENYRSTQNILNAAQAMIEKNTQRTDKRLWTRKKEGEKIKVVKSSTESKEAAFVVEEIERLLKDRKSPIKSLGDIVILYRTNAQSRVLEELLVSSGLPYKIIGSVKFYERREIKDIIAYLRLIKNPRDYVSLRRVANTPPRGIGEVTLQYIIDSDKDNKKNRNSKRVEKFSSLLDFLREESSKKTLSETIELVLKKTKYKKYINDGTVEGESRWENVREFVGVAQKFNELPPKEALESFLEEIALLSPSDEISSNGEFINLMTLHSVKGLEYPVVFITGCEEGLLPHSRSFSELQQLEEERRLCYVGITRAKDVAYLTFTKQRTLFGSTQVNIPSRFVADIPIKLISFKDNTCYDEDIINLES